MNRFDKIIAFVVEKHKNQVDKAGKPYIIHPLTVSFYCEDESAKIVALCHDLLEDTDATVEDLKSIGLADVEIEAVQILTKPKKEDYLSYVEKIAKNPIARTVKMADLTHNMDLTRLETITEKDLKRVEKYKKAFEILMEAEYKELIAESEER